MAFFDGVLVPSQRQLFEAHLDQCSTCRELVAAVADAGLIGVSVAGDAPTPSVTRSDEPETPLERSRRSGAPRDVARSRVRFLAPGATLGRHVIEDVLGADGMAVVYGARDPELDRRVAVKLIRPDLRLEDVQSARLLREAKAMARITHPNVVAVHDVGTYEGQVFVAMELVSGRDLRAWRAERPRSWREVLARYVGAWAVMHRDACEATAVRKEQSPELLDARMTCLRDRLDQLDATVTIWTRADPAIVERAVEAMDALPPVAGCADVAALTAPVPLPDDPALRARVAVLRAGVSRARALTESGRLEEAVELARGLTATTRQVPYRPLQAESSHALGTAQSRLERPQQAEATLREALLAAQAGSDTHREAEIWIDLVHVVGYQLAQYPRADEYSVHAHATLERLDDQGLMRSLRHNLGLIAMRRERWSEAEEHIAHVIEGLERDGEPRDLAAAIDTLASVRDDQGRFRESLTLHERALALREQALGPRHPEVARSHQNLGSAYARTDDLDRARHHYELAAEIRHAVTGRRDDFDTLFARAVLLQESDMEAAASLYRDALAAARSQYSTDHPDVATAAASLGDLLGELGQYDEAALYLERSLEMLQRLDGRESMSAARSMLWLGEVEKLRENHDRAVELFERALAIFERELGGDTLLTAAPLIHLASFHSDSDTPERALPYAERILRIAENSDEMSPAERAMVYSDFAEFLWETRLDRPRARRLATRARDIWADAGPDSADALAEIEAWLAARPLAGKAPR